MIDKSIFFNRALIRPIIYKVFSKFVIGLLILLLWNKYINTNGVYSVVEFGFFIIGLVYALWSWISYLKLDGMKINGFEIFSAKKNKSPHKNHWNKDMIDFVEEPAPNFDKLSDQERNISSFLSNIIVGSIFLIVSIIFSFSNI